MNDLRELLSNHHAPIVAVDAGELPYSDRSTSHVVVVVGIDDHYVYLNDPALTTGAVPVPWGDFDLAWLEKDEQYAVLSLKG